MGTIYRVVLPSIKNQLRFFCLIAISLSLGSGVNGQTDLPRIIPPSPTASALFKYLDYPVDHSTGIPQISVPIYQITSGNLSVPISISYHSSGRKVYDQDGSVALGWSLQAGGMISRTIYGSADFGASPGLFKFPYPFNVTNINMPGDLGYLERIMHFENNATDAPRGLWTDSEYDIFSYSFNGNSGKFLFKDNNNVKTPALLPYKPYIITPVYNAFSLTGINIIDDKGVLYVFGASESYGILQGSAISSFSLTKIISADKTDTISFEYDAFSEERVTISQEIVFNDKNNVTQQHGPFEIAEITDIENTHRDNYQIARLKSISFKQGKVLFNLLAGSDKVDNIQVINTNNEVLKTIQFSRSLCYSQAELSTARHKLDALVFKDKNNNPVETYSFDYYPVITSDGQINVRYCDYWGYYNASGVHDMVPYYTGLQYQFSSGTPIYNTSTVGNPGFNRTPNLEALKSGVLRKITFPTGGSSEFIYENNQYYSNTQQQAKTGPGLRIGRINTEDKNGNIQARVFKYGDNENGYGAIDIEPTLQFMSSEIYHNFTAVDTEPDWLRSGSYRQRTFYSGFNPELSEIADRPVIYTKVTAYQGTEIKNTGKTVYEYDNYAWGPAGMPLSTSLTIGKMHVYYYNYWNNPVLIKQTDFLRKEHAGDISYQKRREITNTYTVTNSEIVSGLHVQRVHNYPQTGNSITTGYPPEKHGLIITGTIPYAYSDYQIPVGSKMLAGTLEQIYNDDNSVITNTHSYTYNAKQLVSQSTQTASDGSSQVTNIKYPFDFAGNTVPDLMTNLNMIDFQVEKIELNNTTPIKSVRTNYVDWGTSWPMIAAQTIEMKKGSNNYETRIRYNGYDAEGNPVSITKEKDAIISYVWDYRNTLPVAEVKNAIASEIAFTSFEADGTGNWTGINTSNIANGTAVTGSFYYNFNGSTLSKTGLNNSKSYTLSYWSKNGVYNVSGTPVAGWPKSIRSVVINGVSWTCWEHRVSGINTISIGGAGSIDELRLYPADGQLVSYCYKPLVGPITRNDFNNSIQYYEYDAYGRLKLIRDMDNNIIKTFNYQYRSATP